MANPARGETQVRIGPTIYTLAFDLNVICEVEAALGEPIADVASRLEASRAGIRDLRALLWAGLQRHHPQPLERVGHLLQAALTDAETAQTVGEQIVAAMAGSFPPPPPAATPATPPAKLGRRSSTPKRSRRGSKPPARGA